MGFSVPLLAIRATDQEGDSLEHRQGHRRVSPYGDRAAWRPSGASGAPFRVIGVGGPRSPPSIDRHRPKERGGFFVGRTCRHRGSTQRAISHKERLGLCLDFSVNAYGYKLGAMQAGPAAYGNLSGARGRLKLIALEQEGEDVRTIVRLSSRSTSSHARLLPTPVTVCRSAQGCAKIGSRRFSGGMVHWTRLSAHEMHSPLAIWPQTDRLQDGA